MAHSPNSLDLSSILHIVGVSYDISFSGTFTANLDWVSAFVYLEYEPAMHLHDDNIPK